MPPTVAGPITTCINIHINISIETYYQRAINWINSISTSHDSCDLNLQSICFGAFSLVKPLRFYSKIKLREKNSLCLHTLLFDRAYAINCLVSASGTPSAIIATTLMVGCFIAAIEEAAALQIY